ncbi:MAG: hypothetical protein MPJ22_09710, partial [Pirellulales bacterium]|nr:hypothetical protein [Pirellulales bacterium]
MVATAIAAVVMAGHKNNHTISPSVAFSGTLTGEKPIGPSLLQKPKASKSPAPSRAKSEDLDIFFIRVIVNKKWEHGKVPLRPSLLLRPRMRLVID